MYAVRKAIKMMYKIIVGVGSVAVVLAIVVLVYHSCLLIKS